MSKTSLATLINSARVTVTKHSPEILMGIGIAGMVTTTVLAVRATPKALMLVDERKKELHVDKLEPLELVKTAWKPYIPAVVTGVASTACLIGSNSVSARRTAAIATAYKISETALTEYREKVVETIGEKKEKAVREKVAKERIEKNPVRNSEVVITKAGNTLCFDPLSARYFKSDIEKIRKAVNELNKEMLHDISGYVSLNELYSALDLEPSMIGDDMGWNVTKGLIEIDFGSQLTEDGTPCVVLDYIVAPRYDYSRIV